MKINLVKVPYVKTPSLDATLTERFTDREQLISTIKAMAKRKPQLREAVGNATLKIRQGYKYTFRNGNLICHTATVKMY